MNEQHDFISRRAFQRRCAAMATGLLGATAGAASSQVGWVANKQVGCCIDLRPHQKAIT